MELVHCGRRGGVERKTTQAKGQKKGLDRGKGEGAFVQEGSKFL